MEKVKKYAFHVLTKRIKYHKRIHNAMCFLIYSHAFYLLIVFSVRSGASGLNNPSHEIKCGASLSRVTELP